MPATTPRHSDLIYRRHLGPDSLKITPGATRAWNHYLNKKLMPVYLKLALILTFFLLLFGLPFLKILTCDFPLK